MRNASEDLPDALSAINYISMSMPLLAPFVPIYKGLPGDALPPEMTNATSMPDELSLFWRARRLQALVFQDFPRLAPAATQAIAEWEAGVEDKLRPEMEKEYIDKWAAGDKEGAQALLAEFTQEVAAQAGELLDGLTEDAAKALSLNGVPPMEQLRAWLFNATTEYLFHHGDN